MKINNFNNIIIACYMILNVLFSNIKAEDPSDALFIKSPPIEMQNVISITKPLAVPCAKLFLVYKLGYITHTLLQAVKIVHIQYAMLDHLFSQRMHGRTEPLILKRKYGFIKGFKLYNYYYITNYSRMLF